ncbi:MAG: hypothetical protein LKE46_13980 [Clostridium sp.]|uniref:hypothetical protein n=1 Tax=Clostridium sp. TaxID=1506 RepID=UPI0025BBCF39|nr:hypothetical protein [Clostridium sp.]MCH3965365.1 hypothetical protein [Clostridium sp.]MCI1869658.1 hypothetical protein [Clostridium sp.]
MQSPKEAVLNPGIFQLQSLTIKAIIIELTKVLEETLNPEVFQIHRNPVQALLKNKVMIIGTTTMVIASVHFSRYLFQSPGDKDMGLAIIIMDKVVFYQDFSGDLLNL